MSQEDENLSSSSDEAPEVPETKVADAVAPAAVSDLGEENEDEGDEGFSFTALSPPLSGLPEARTTSITRIVTTSPPRKALRPRSYTSAFANVTLPPRTTSQGTHFVG